MDVFISYNRTDRMLADAICFALEKAGVKTWFAEKDLLEGDPFATKIKVEIQECKCVIVIVSRFSGASGHVMNEAANAKKANAHIIPYKTDTERTDLSEYLGGYNWIDAVDDPYGGIGKVVEAVLLKLGMQAQEPEHELNSFDGIKPMKKTVGKLVFFTFMAQILLITWYLSLNIGVYYFALFVAAALITIIIPLTQINKCSFIGCRRRVSGEKVSVKNIRIGKIEKYSFCGEHRYTLSMEKYRQKSSKIIWSVICIAMLTVFMVLAAILYEIRPADFWTFEKTAQPTTESAQELSNSVAPVSQGIVGIERLGKLYISNEALYESITDEMGGLCAVSAVRDHLAAARFDGSILFAGDNSYGQCESGAFEGVNAVDVECGDGFTVILSCAGNIYGIGRNDMGQIDFGSISNVAEISAGENHVMALKKDGTVLAFGDNTYMQCDVSKWENIVQISAGENISAALTGDGTVMTTAGNTDSWSDIVQVAAGKSMVAALTKKGRVHILSTDNYDVPDVSGWRNIETVAIYGDHVVGIKSDGTVMDSYIEDETHMISDLRLGAPALSIDEAEYYSLRLSAGDGFAFYVSDEGDIRAIGDAPGFGFTGFEGVLQIGASKELAAAILSDHSMACEYGADTNLDLSGWHNIAYFDLAENCAVGVMPDGHIIYNGNDDYGQSSIQSVSDAVMVAADAKHVAAVLSDGSVICAGDNECGECDIDGLKDAVWVDTGSCHTAAIRADGTAMAFGKNDEGQCDVSEWYDVVSLTVGDGFSVGIKSDGTLLTAGTIDLSAYSNDSTAAVAVDAFGKYCFIMMEDGSAYMAESR